MEVALHLWHNLPTDVFKILSIHLVGKKDMQDIDHKKGDNETIYSGVDYSGDHLLQETIYFVTVLPELHFPRARSRFSNIHTLVSPVPTMATILKTRMELYILRSARLDGIR